MREDGWVVRRVGEDVTRLNLVPHPVYSHWKRNRANVGNELYTRSPGAPGGLPRARPPSVLLVAATEELLCDRSSKELHLLSVLRCGVFIY